MFGSPAAINGIALSHSNNMKASVLVIETFEQHDKNSSKTENFHAHSMR